MSGYRFARQDDREGLEAIVDGESPTLQASRLADAILQVADTVAQLEEKVRAAVALATETSRVVETLPAPPPGFPGTLRDWYAGLALGGVITEKFPGPPGYSVVEKAEVIATQTFVIADAMIEARGHGG